MALSSSRLAELPRDSIVREHLARGGCRRESLDPLPLKARAIFSAGLDVFEREPFIPSALKRLPNVVLLPLIWELTLSAREGMARLAISGILAVLNGKTPPNEVKFRHS